MRNKIIGILGAKISKPPFFCREKKIGEIGPIYVDEMNFKKE